MAVHVAQMTAQEAMRACFDSVTIRGAQIMGLTGYGIAPGCHADFVLLQARSAVEAVRLKPTRLLVVKAGRVIARTPPRRTALFLEARPTLVDPAAYGSPLE
jgi:cytosine deaminase